MGRNQRNIYMFIHDENRQYCKAVQSSDGSYTITKSGQPYPLKFNPSNLRNSSLEFATNNSYFSLNRSITYPLEFIKDGAAILRDFYHFGSGTEAKAYLTVVEWSGSLGYYVESYNGKFDFSQKEEDPRTASFTVSTVDDSAWGVLSQNDGVTYSVECNANNPKAIRVLVDGITLINRYTFQTVASPLINNTEVNTHLLPIVLINQDGDSAGIITKSQQDEQVGWNGFVPPKGSYFLLTAYAIEGVNVAGNITFTWSTDGASSGGIAIYFITNNGSMEDRSVVFQMTENMIPGKTYNVEFNLNFDLIPDERLYLVVHMTSAAANNFTITPIASNIYVSTRTKAQPAVCYALRPLDLLKDIVNQATNGRYTINSEYFTENDNTVLTCGDSLRGVQNAKIFSSFEEFFKTFNALFFMALRSIKGQLWMEKATEVYRIDTGNMMELGEALEVKIAPAGDYFFNEVIVGSPDQDYRHPSGRMEFNSENTYSLPIQSYKKKKEIVTAYRTGCYDIQFLILDYQGGSTVDNKGDKSVYVLDITDTLSSALEEIQTFENITVDNAPLQPFIKYPKYGDVITNATPTVTGVAPSGSTINIFVDDILDGTATANVLGDWSYNIVTELGSYIPDIDDGLHVIKATYTDLNAPISEVTITVNTTITTVEQIIYPAQSDSLYNNMPLIHGVAQAGTAIFILMDGVDWGTVTADGSGRWSYKSQPIPNGSHTVSINSGVDTASFFVDSFVSSPLITYVGSELDGFPIVNNLPLIRGVAIPLTQVTVWLNYIQYEPLGTATADENGNWELQVVPTTYEEPGSTVPLTLAPIRNGLSTVSTSLVNKTVAINVFGYTLNRPVYDSISGVTDNTVFNVELSPKRMMMNHYPMFASVLDKQPSASLVFQKASKNANLVTEINGITISERTNIHRSELGDKLVHLEYCILKVKTRKPFIRVLEDFNNGGLIKVTYRGNNLFLMPIGSMRIGNIVDDVQTWKLLFSPLTSPTTLLNLYKNGTTITIMRNAIYHSDYNTLHFVTYNFQKSPKYNFMEIFEDWFENRNTAWALNPHYVQKLQRTETIVDQVVTNGITNLTLTMFRCSDAVAVANVAYQPLSPAPIPLPDIVLQASIDLALYPEDQYFFVLNMADPTSGSDFNIYHPTMVPAETTTFTFFVSGSPNAGDRAIVYIYSSTSLFDTSLSTVSFESTVLEGWTLDDIIDDLYDKIDANTSLGITNIEYVSDGANPGLRLTRSPYIRGFVRKTLFLTGSIPAAISERIETRNNWPNTILIEARSTVNLTGCFFSNGFKSIIRVEGLVKKVQPQVTSVVATDISGTSELLFGSVARKREIRFGTAYGLPDYLYMKVASAIALDDLRIENVAYTLSESESISPSDDIDGHPLYYYNVILNLKSNDIGFTINEDFLDPETTEPEGVILVVDAPAFGLPAGSLINIEIRNE